MKVAKLITVVLTTRVVVDSDMSIEDILEACKPKFRDKVNRELSENLDEITLDTECPFNPEMDGPDDDDPDKGPTPQEIKSMERMSRNLELIDDDDEDDIRFHLPKH
jgi:hypothetical protein